MSVWWEEEEVTDSSGSQEDIDMVNHRLLKRVGVVAEQALNISNNTFEMLADLLESQRDIDRKAGKSDMESAAAQVDIQAYRNAAAGMIDVVKKVLGR